MREPENGAASDVVAMQIVTVGSNATPRIEALQAAGDYCGGILSSRFLGPGRPKRSPSYASPHPAELGLKSERGKRYSWGYGACPDLEQHAVVFDLLDANGEIGVTLTPGFQIVPEQSTAAIVMHHPKAAYFNAAATRELAAS